MAEEHRIGGITDEQKEQLADDLLKIKQQTDSAQVVLALFSHNGHVDIVHYGEDEGPSFAVAGLMLQAIDSLLDLPPQLWTAIPTAVQKLRRLAAAGEIDREGDDSKPKYN